jgi:predicted  nucleic acid-binding Zn-ribbon protein
MDIKEALVQIKRVPSVLEAFKSIDELLSLASLTMTEIDGLTQEKADLEAAISLRKSDFEQLKENCIAQTIQLTNNLEKARADTKEQMKNLRDSVNKDYDTAAAASNAKITEMNDKATALKIEIKNLVREIVDKQELLDGLKKSIEAIKARLVN